MVSCIRCGLPLSGVIIGHESGTWHENCPNAAGSTSPLDQAEYERKRDEVIENFVSRLPIRATEIGWEKVGEESQDLAEVLDSLLESRLKALLIPEKIKLLNHIIHQDRYTNRDSYISKLISDLEEELKDGQRT